MTPLGSSFEGTRRSYDSAVLDERDVDPDPIVQLRQWLAEAEAAGVFEHNAMGVSTVGADGAPASRNVLLRRLDERGLAFFTSFDSDKAAEISHEPRVALLFSWLEMHRQVRIVGRCERLDDESSDAYFAGRPRESQIASIASPQSQVLAGRDELDQLVSDAERRYEGVDPVPRPANWGGFLVTPSAVELWQGRAMRLHDRLRYSRRGELWTIERLAP